ncbi:hypothetical protein Ahy_A09g045161 [Arachis hypogaea]|uniref:Protein DETOXIFICATION n=1 Tax=Arachis hypogaea TaxID=3818 RepID=A0A445BLQ7_ARAHY|nr:hypothetical protein Ahy_A09g045161 [Arachis hypogaea]
MAAFQTCLQVWLTSSLLADGLADAVQAILACAFAEKNFDKVTAAAIRTLQMSFILGVALSLVVGVGLYFGAGVFSKSLLVIHLIRVGIPFVAATQPINSLAFVFDGVNYGASNFAYFAYSLGSTVDMIDLNRDDAGSEDANLLFSGHRARITYMRDRLPQSDIHSAAACSR